MVQPGELLCIPEAKLDLESCVVKFDDVLSGHVDVRGEVYLMSSCFGIVYNYLDVPLHGLGICLDDIYLSLIRFKTFTTGEVEIVKINLFPLYPWTSSFPGPYSVM